MSKKLHYLSINGLAEAIRYMLHYCGEEFEDIWYDRSTWPVENVKESLPYGQFPVYEEGKRKLNQSVAIARYIAARAKLIPSDLWEQAKLDATVLNLYDFLMKLTPIIYEKDPVKKNELKEKLFEENVKYYFSRFEEELKKGNGHFGGKLSWADFVLVGIVETVELLIEEEIAAKYPTVNELIHLIRNLPGVKEYIAKRMPFKL